MRPTIALVGRANVGKSTLFNRLTRSRAALVADRPGLTRDRKYGIADLGGRECWLIDTGGLGGDEPLAADVTRQTELAVEAADAVVMLVDARAGLSATDERIAERLRAQGKPVLVAANKTEGLDTAQATTELHALGLGTPYPIAAEHGQGIAALVEAVIATLPAADVSDAEAFETGIRVAVVGRPNVGKSTLVNRLVGESRVLTADEPGTTRDSVAAPFERDGHRYVLVDTAGVRRRARVQESLERLSVLKSLQAIEAAQVTVLVLDARAGVVAQDASLLGLVVEAGRGLVIAVNKWDGLDVEAKQACRRELERRLGFAAFVERRTLSALHGSGVGELMAAVRRAHDSATRKLSTPELSRLLERAVAGHPPPAVQGRRIRLRYAHQGGQSPLRIVIHGNQTQHLPPTYRRYLAGFFREQLALTGTPLHLIFRTGENPYT